jgi:1,4-dihydroxy-2-naphthoate octaprenyltransferase
MKRFLALLRLARPELLTFAALTYALGAVLARYLGFFRSFAAFWTGFVAALSLLLAANLLNAWFLPKKWERVLWGTDIPPKERDWLRAASFQIALGALGAAGFALLALLAANRLSLSAALFFLLLALAALSEALPPLRLAESGYGEFLDTANLAIFLPAFGFFLQSSEYHRLLAMNAFPLSLLTLAAFLALDFSTYARDAKIARPTLLTRMDWRNGIRLHHALILAAFLLFASWIFLGLRAELLAPILLALPFAAFQIFHLQRIGEGGAPRWKFLRLLALAVPALTVYLLVMIFWFH